jgi:hypothetical protein
MARTRGRSGALASRPHHVEPSAARAVAQVSAEHSGAGDDVELNVMLEQVMIPSQPESVVGNPAVDAVRGGSR